MAKLEHISLYNLSMEKLVSDLAKHVENSEDQQLAKNKYCLFYPMLGKDYYEKKELIVYEQYVNDWRPVVKLTKDKKKIESMVKKAQEYSTVSKGCALDWVNKNWIKQSLYRSFFWNITYKLAMERYGRTDKDWNNIIAYSTLFKIAPTGENNMPDEIKKGQLHNVTHLFKEELSLLQPKNVLLITSLQNWAEPVLKAAGIKYEKHSGGYVQATTAYRGSKIIVIEKPFSAKHREFTDEIKREMV